MGELFAVDGRATRSRERKRCYAAINGDGVQPRANASTEFVAPARVTTRDVVCTVRGAVAEITITVNGERKRVDAACTVADLIASMNLRGPVAVERNQTIVVRAEHASTTLADGDQLEVVSFVGGG
jgi:sulfur carrier protein